MALNRWLTDEERARAAANGISTKTLYYRLY
ncbi:nucleoside permease, partial [Bacillus cereus]|nr:nucleoside permease [Bacillus cereus]